MAGAEAAHESLSQAIYAYPHEHYAFWQTVSAQARVLAWGEELPHGRLAEDLTIEGLLETKAWVGDVLRFPGCVLAVSEPGRPGEVLNRSMGFSQASTLMVQSRWCGFFLAVREPGWIESGDVFELIPGPREVNISDLFEGRWVAAR